MAPENPLILARGCGIKGQVRRAPAGRPWILSPGASRLRLPLPCPGCSHLAPGAVAPSHLPVSAPGTLLRPRDSRLPGRREGPSQRHVPRGFQRRSRTSVTGRGDTLPSPDLSPGSPGASQSPLQAGVCPGPPGWLTSRLRSPGTPSRGLGRERGEPTSRQGQAPVLLQLQGAARRLRPEIPVHPSLPPLSVLCSVLTCWVYLEIHPKSLPPGHMTPTNDMF